MNTKVKDTATDVVKIAATALLTGAAVETTFKGSEMMFSDVRAIGKCIKHAVNPDVYRVKFGKNPFAKPVNVNINPVTGRIKKDRTGKAPKNKKTITLLKEVK